MFLIIIKNILPKEVIEKKFYIGNIEIKNEAQIKKIANIKTINNPLIHKGLDPNDIFIKKTETAISNLLKLSQTNLGNVLLSESTILQTYTKLKKFHLTKVINILFAITKKYIQKQITSKNPSLFLFDCYKIGYLCHISQK